MLSILNKIKAFIAKAFTKTKKIVNLPQGEEFENWLGV
jgi:hypothetical protein